MIARVLAAGAIMAAGAPAAAQAQSECFDHATFDRLLAGHVSAEGLVDYAGIAEAAELDLYLASLAAATLDRLPPRERLALWINAYNAYTIALIVRHDERESIRNINRTLGLFAGKGPWKERFATVAGQTYTLDEIQNEIIRKRFDEPRVHFALVCAALGCPPLRREAYVGSRLDEQLDDQARTFLTESPRKNRVDAAAGVVHLSPIFRWYRDDFPAGPRGLGRFLADLFPPGPERSLLEGGRFDVRYTRYDWALNARR
jgi:hypothetical protein